MQYNCVLALNQRSPTCGTPGSKAWKILWIKSLWGIAKEKAEFTAVTRHGLQVYNFVVRTWSKSLKNGRTGEKLETADILEIIFPYNDLCKNLSFREEAKNRRQWFCMAA